METQFEKLYPQLFRKPSISQWYVNNYVIVHFSAVIRAHHTLGDLWKTEADLVHGSRGW